MSRWLQSGRRRNKTRRNKLTETWHLLKGRGARSGPAARALGCVATQGGAGGWRGPRGCRAGGGAAAKPAGLRARGRSYLRGRGRTDSAGFSAGEGCPQGRGRESAWSSGEKGPCEAAGVTGQLARACARAPVCACAVRACVRARGRHGLSLEGAALRLWPGCPLCVRDVKQRRLARRVFGSAA